MSLLSAVCRWNQPIDVNGPMKVVWWVEFYRVPKSGMTKLEVLIATWGSRYRKDINYRQGVKRKEAREKLHKFHSGSPTNCFRWIAISVNAHSIWRALIVIRQLTSIMICTSTMPWCQQRPHFRYPSSSRQMRSRCRCGWSLIPHSHMELCLRSTTASMSFIFIFLTIDELTPPFPLP